MQCNEVSQCYRVGGTLGQLSVSSGSNYSLSDVIIQQPRPVDPSLRVSLHHSPALSCHLFLSHSSHVLGQWEGGGHTTEDRLQGSVLPHYFTGCFSAMSGKCGGPGLFITGSAWVVAIFSLARLTRHHRWSWGGCCACHPWGLMADCSPCLHIHFWRHSMLRESFFYVQEIFAIHQKACVIRWIHSFYCHRRFLMPVPQMKNIDTCNSSTVTHTFMSLHILTYLSPHLYINIPV